MSVSGCLGVGCAVEFVGDEDKTAGADNAGMGDCICCSNFEIDPGAIEGLLSVFVGIDCFDVAGDSVVAAGAFDTVVIKLSPGDHAALAVALSVRR